MKMASLGIFAGAAVQYRKLLRSQYWNLDRQAAYVRTHLDETLLAAARIPFYAKRFDGDPRSREFRTLPILSRSDVAKLNESVRSLYPLNAWFSSDSSSGSTGMPAEFLFDTSHQAGRFAARARYLFESGWTPFRKSVWLIYTGFYTVTEDRALIRSRLLPFTYFPEISTDFRNLALEIARIDPVCLYAYPSFLDALLDGLKSTGIRLRSLRHVLTGSEVVDHHLRQRTRSIAGLDIADNYGSTEGFVAWQCDRGKYHVNSEHVLVEIVDEGGAPSRPGEMGRVLLTTLQNRLMPLVRYEIGDYAIASTEPCKCGRTPPLLERVVGRSVNLFRLRGGKLLSPWLLMGALRDRIELKQYQIVQHAIDRFEITLVIDQPWLPEQERLLREDFSRIIGNEVELSLQRVASIGRTPGRKFMSTVSKLVGA
jgi:phenylacetate-coenzyme A ligase PaaK-like adenylate-forming protein